MSTNRQQALGLAEIDSQSCDKLPISPNEPVDAWVLTTKAEGTRLAGWQISKIFNNEVKVLESSERCTVTKFCYPIGAKLVKAKLIKK
jgi:hypothetical protein